MVDMYVQSVMDRKDLGTLLCDIVAAFSIKNFWYRVLQIHGNVENHFLIICLDLCLLKKKRVSEGKINQ